MLWIASAAVDSAGSVIGFGVITRDTGESSGSPCSTTRSRRSLSVNTPTGAAPSSTTMIERTARSFIWVSASRSDVVARQVTGSEGISCASGRVSEC